MTYSNIIGAPCEATRIIWAFIDGNFVGFLEIDDICIPLDIKPGQSIVGMSTDPTATVVTKFGICEIYLIPGKLVPIT